MGVCSGRSDTRHSHADKVLATMWTLLVSQIPAVVVGGALLIWWMLKPRTRSSLDLELGPSQQQQSWQRRERRFLFWSNTTRQGERATLTPRRGTSSMLASTMLVRWEAGV